MTSTTSGKILLVEDDQNFGDVLRSYLEMNDYDVTLANDGIKGLESYNSDDFDPVVMSDGRMNDPKAMLSGTTPSKARWMALAPSARRPSTSAGADHRRS